MLDRFGQDPFAGLEGADVSGWMVAHHGFEKLPEAAFLDGMSYPWLERFDRRSSSYFGFAGPGGDQLRPGQRLTVGQKLVSANKQYSLLFQKDGNLVLYKGAHPYWTTNTGGRGGTHAEMQPDGNFVLYTAANVPVWDTHSYGHGGAYLAMQDDGNLVVQYGTNAVWSSETWGGVHHESTGFLHDLGSAVSTVAHAVTHNPVADLASKAISVVNIPLHIAQQALNVITHNPIWDAAQSVMSFVPLIGTAVSSGMSIAATIGKGGSMQDIALAAAKGALPGQPISGYAFDVAVGLLLHGKPDAAALEFARNQVPGGEIGKHAFDLAVSIILGKHVNVADAAVKAAKSALPNVPIIHAAFEAGAGMGKAVSSAASVQRVVNALPPQARNAFHAGLAAAKANQITPHNAAAVKASISAGPHGAAMQKAVSNALAVHTEAAKRTMAQIAYAAALKHVIALNQGHPHAKAGMAVIAQRAKQGDKAALASTAIISIASKELQKRGAVPPSPAAVASGEAMMIAGFSFGAVKSLPDAGLATWIAPHVKGTHGNFLVRY